MDTVLKLFKLIIIKIRCVLIKIFCFPKILFINFYYFPFAVAIRFPIYIGYQVPLHRLGRRNAIHLARIESGIFRFGLDNGSFDLGKKSSGFWDIGENGELFIGGKASFSKGSVLIVDGKISIGDNFYCNANCIINSSQSITIGSDCLLGWSVTVLDGDGHSIFNEEGKRINYPAEISIGNNVWLCSESLVLKGASINNDSVLAARSCLTTSLNESNVVIAGIPAKIVKKNITWKR
ncbi:MAG: acyltransferase [Lentisphaerae bacterium]|nr:acyltransferase [Lentisphaerota bacterium]